MWSTQSQPDCNYGTVQKPKGENIMIHNVAVILNILQLGILFFLFFAATTPFALSIGMVVLLLLIFLTPVFNLIGMHAFKKVEQ